MDITILSMSLINSRIDYKDAKPMY